MRVVVAPDKFKGTLTAVEAAEAIAAGWQEGDPRARVERVPVADGGEGTLETLVHALDGRRERARVLGPLGDPIDAQYGLAHTPGGLVAIVEMARASGLGLLASSRRDALHATSRGTGDLILAAASHRPRRVLVCVGGSATTDAGAGMAQALGIRLLDEAGRELSGGAALRRLARIDATGVAAEVRDLDVVVALDVDNPLTGAAGAAAVYGPQKGARPEDVRILDEGLGRFAAVVHRDLGIDVRHVPGAGAAGGLGAGLLAFLGARLRPGFDLVAEALGLPARLEAADACVTGEGRFDAQTARGKAPGGVLRLAREAGCRSVLIAGDVAAGIVPDADHVYSLAARMGRAGALADAGRALRSCAAEAARAILGDG